MRLVSKLIDNRLGRAAVFALLAALCAILLSGCSRGTTTRSSEDAESTSAEETNDEIAPVYGNYDESVAVANVNEKGSPYFGILYATVLDVNGNYGESKTVYSFMDKSDPENAWSVTGLEIADIEAELTPGVDVAILFHGDIIRDGENLEFIAILPDGQYQIRRAEGVTLSNTMSSFTLQTTIGNLVFTKDNCHIEEGAMSTDGGDRVVVYYADGGEFGKFPFSVYALQ